VLGFDESTLRQWRKLDGAPNGDDAEEWRAFIKANNLGRGASSKSINELRAEKLAVETRLLHLKEQQAKGELVEVGEVREYLGRVAAKFDQLLTQKIDTEIPARLLGKDIVAARAEASLVHDEIREVVNAGLTQWKPEPK
jgi:ribosomal protein L29